MKIIVKENGELLDYLYKNLDMSKKENKIIFNTWLYLY